MNNEENIYADIEEKEYETVFDGVINGFVERNGFSMMIIGMIIVFVSNCINFVSLEMYMSIVGILFMIFFIIFFVLMIMSLIKTKYTVPLSGNTLYPICSEEEKLQSIQRAEHAEEIEMKCLDINYPVRYCVKCKEFRLPRSYHCNKCNRCIEGRDHHCYLLQTCIGKNNFKFFYLTILYASLSFIFTGLFKVIDIVLKLNYFVTVEGESSLLGNLIIFCGSLFIDMIVLCISIILIFVLIDMFIGYTKVILTNRTSAEQYEYTQLRELTNDEYPVEYTFSNYKEFLDDNIIRSLLPIKRVDKEHI